GSYDIEAVHNHTRGHTCELSNLRKDRAGGAPGRRFSPRSRSDHLRARRAGRAVPRRRCGSLSASQIVLLGLAGVAAGTINSVVGSGTLVTFPVLLAFGYPPVTANVSNTIGLVPGSFAGAWGYRRRLVGERANVVRLGAASVLGGVVGAALLLSLPASTFDAIVPAFIAVALVLTMFQTRLRARLERRARPSHHRGAVTALAVFASGIYGGYFGAG